VTGKGGEEEKRDLSRPRCDGEERRRKERTSLGLVVTEKRRGEEEGPL